jgi:hypothetical protein
VLLLLMFFSLFVVCVFVELLGLAYASFLFMRIFGCLCLRVGTC